jgi:hypothetical protein
MDPYAKAITTCFKDKDTLFLPYSVKRPLPSISDIPYSKGKGF